MAVELSDALWRVYNCSSQRLPASASYFWDNRDREPVGGVCIQAVIAGQVAVHRPDGTTVLAGAGEAFLFRHGEASSYGFPPGNRLPYITRWVNLRGAGLSAHWDALRAGCGWVVPLTAELDHHLDHLTAIGDPHARVPATTVAAAAHAFVMHLAESGAAAVHASASPVDRAIDELVAAPFASWSLKQVAGSHGVSREHLSRAFAARLGLPPAAWLARERSARAIELLRGSDLGVAEIARACGFGSAHTLARQVKAFTGGSPESLRHR